MHRIVRWNGLLKLIEPYYPRLNRPEFTRTLVTSLEKTKNSTIRHNNGRSIYPLIDAALGCKPSAPDAQCSYLAARDWEPRHKLL
jgi:hypothetical protein